MEIQNSYLLIKQNIDEQSEKISSRDHTFFHVDRFLLVAEKMKLHDQECTECKHNLNEMVDFSLEIGNLISGSPKERRFYEKQNDKWLRHLKKAHGYAIKGYITAVYTFVAMIIGAFMGWLLSLLIVGSQRISIPTGWFVGTVVGRFLGAKKEKNLSLNNKLL